KTIEKDGKTYELVKVKDGDKENGKVVDGTTEVTYIYKEVTKPTPTPETPKDPGKYIPYIEDPENPNRPEDPTPVPYDETPEDPTDNPPLPYVPGYEPKVPGTNEPLKPVDPNDPTKGYIPPTITDPNDPTKDTPVPYVPVAKEGNVIVHYVDEQGNVIKDPVEDTPKSKVGTEYDTTDNKPKTIEKDGKTYELVKVKDGDKENGKV
ncbi:MucBP domain-containing protein, partial [Streptococcus danieliae]|nr:MucBP domain-containing protein [Streptococcus danieliae]